LACRRAERLRHTLRFAISITLIPFVVIFPELRYGF
jgi:hypothetical protein